MQCPKCGSNKLQQRAWIDLKTKKVVDFEGHYFCDDCGTHFQHEVLIIKIVKDAGPLQKPLAAPQLGLLF